MVNLSLGGVVRPKLWSCIKKFKCWWVQRGFVGRGGGGDQSTSGLLRSTAAWRSSCSAGPKKRSQAEDRAGWNRLALLVPYQEVLHGETDGASARGNLSCPCSSGNGRCYLGLRRKLLAVGESRYSRDYSSRWFQLIHFWETCHGSVHGYDSWSIALGCLPTIFDWPMTARSTSTIGRAGSVLAVSTAQIFPFTASTPLCTVSLICPLFSATTVRACFTAVHGFRDLFTASVVAPMAPIAPMALCSQCSVEKLEDELEDDSWECWTLSPLYERPLRSFLLLAL